MPWEYSTDPFPACAWPALSAHMQALLVRSMLSLGLNLSKAGEGAGRGPPGLTRVATQPYHPQALGHTGVACSFAALMTGPVLEPGLSKT